MKENKSNCGSSNGMTVKSNYAATVSAQNAKPNPSVKPISIPHKGGK